MNNTSGFILRTLPVDELEFSSISTAFALAQDQARPLNSKFKVTSDKEAKYVVETN